MLWQVDPTDAAPLYEQIASSVRRAVAEGELTDGERLPPAKHLAASLEVNLHTVLKAYQVLRDEGCLELRRGRGAVIIAKKPDAPDIGELISELVRSARAMGIPDMQLMALLVERMGDGHEN